MFQRNKKTKELRPPCNEKGAEEGSNNILNRKEGEGTRVLAREDLKKGGKRKFHDQGLTKTSPSDSTKKNESLDVRGKIIRARSTTPRKFKEQNKGKATASASPSWNRWR